MHKLHFLLCDVSGEMGQESTYEILGEHKGEVVKVEEVMYQDSLIKDRKVTLTCRYPFAAFIEILQKRAHGALTYSGETRVSKEEGLK